MAKEKINKHSESATVPDGTISENEQVKSVDPTATRAKLTLTSGIIKRYIMTSERQKEERLYLQVHGLRAQAPQALNKMLVQAISTMRRGLYAESVGELSAAEAEVLRSGGAVLEEQPGSDPMADDALAAFETDPRREHMAGDGGDTDQDHPG